MFQRILDFATIEDEEKVLPPLISYSIVKESIRYVRYCHINLYCQTEEGAIVAKLALSCGKSLYAASELDMTLKFYWEGGIARLLINEKSVNRFRLSTTPDLEGAVIQEH